MVQNKLFLEAVFNGRYPDEVVEWHRRFGVADQIDLEALAAARQPIDFLGVNYTRNRVRHWRARSRTWPGADEAVIVSPKALTDMGWAVDPRA